MSSEEYYAMHQRAFRCAFDYLNAHFPPGQDPDWWTKASDDIRNSADEHEGNQLAMFLLIGVLDYLNEEYKRRYINVERGEK